MTKTSKMGRPRLPKGKAKGERLQVRLTPAERKAILNASKRLGLSETDWARKVLLAATLSARF